jgi:hypothetical protein
MMRRFSQRDIALLLIAASLLVAGISFFAAAYPTPLTLQITEGDTTIRFSAERRVVLTAGTCIEVQWQLEHIQTVTFNDRPTTGADRATACIDRDTLPRLHVSTVWGIAGQRLLSRSRRVCSALSLSAARLPLGWA